MLGTKLISKVRKYLIRGLLIVLPVGGTFLLCWKLYEILDGLVLQYIRELLSYFKVPSAPALEVAALVICVFLVGIIGGNFIGRWFLRLMNRIIDKLPLVRVIYPAFQQILEAIFKEDQRAFSKVVLIEYPRKGLYSLGFVSVEARGVVQAQVEEEMWSVFVPTTPNPTSGVLIFVPKVDARVLDMTVDQAAKLIMSAGVIHEGEGTSAA